VISSSCSQTFFQVNAAWAAISSDNLEDDIIGSEDEPSFGEDESGSEYCWTSDTGSEWSEGRDGQDFDSYYDYGDLDETGGRYVVQVEDDREISLEEHASICDCGL
jgi:hypothetical protein